MTDNGAGIPADIADRLLTSFSTEPSGLGISLSICRSIIQDHGGQLRVSDDGEEPGAVFRFALPSCRQH